MDLKSTEFAKIIDEVMSDPLLQSNPAAFFRRVAHARGAISIRAMTARLWPEMRLRPFLLNALKDHNFISDYLFLSRSHLASGTKGQVLVGINLEMIAEDHLHQGQAIEFVHFMRDFSYLIDEIPVQFARLLASIGNWEEALQILKRSFHDGDIDCLYAIGWIEFHCGNKKTATIYRNQLEHSYAQKVKELLNTHSVEKSVQLINQNRPMREVFPFIGIAHWHRIAASNPKLAAEISYHLYNTLKLVHPEPSNHEIYDAIYEDDIQSSDSLTTTALMNRGINVSCLSILSVPSEIIEIYSNSIDQSLIFASQMTRRADESFYHGTWGKSESQNLLKIEDMLRGVELHGGLRTINPVSLRPCVTRESHYINGIFAYHFTDEHPFWMYSCGWAFGRFGLWLPHQNVSVNTRRMLRGNAREVAHKISAYMTEYRAEIAEQKNKERKTAVICGLNANIGHHYHNELSGLYRAKLNQLFNNIDIYVSGRYDYYEADTLIDIKAKKRHKISSDRELTSITLQESLFLIWPTDVSAFNGLGDLIIKRSACKSHSNEFYRIRAALAESDIAILFNLRTKQRIWVHQNFAIQAILQCVKAVAMRFNRTKILLVIDGATRTSVSDQAESDMIAKEQAVFDQIYEAPEMSRFRESLFSAIGLNLYEKAALFSKIDFAICPKGNGHLPTVAWISRVPTLLHSNSMDIRDAGTENSFCDMPAAPSILGRPAMSDALDQLSGTLRWSGDGWQDFMQENYTLDMEYVLAIIEKRITQIMCKK